MFLQTFFIDMTGLLFHNSYSSFTGKLFDCVYTLIDLCFVSCDLIHNSDQYNAALTGINLFGLGVVLSMTIFYRF